jgi:hypothetical protein
MTRRIDRESAVFDVEVEKIEGCGLRDLRYLDAAKVAIRHRGNDLVTSKLVLEVVSQVVLR